MKIKAIFLVMIMLLLMPINGIAAEKSPAKADFKIPSSVITISKENTYPNSAQDLPYLEPSPLAKSMLKTSSVPISNPDLIRLLNESSISASKIAFWYRAKIYLGQWPLSYQSTETTLNWDYQEVNVNRLDNRGGKAFAKLMYNQAMHKKVTGGLTSNIPNSEAVKKMMMITAAEKTHLPLAFQTVVGGGTKTTNYYNISPKQVGYLYSYVPAVNERGRITYGEVYIVLKGGKRAIEVQNVTQQGIGAWIPIQDHLSFRFHAGNM